MSQAGLIPFKTKKQLDERNGKIVKDLSLQLENRNCVECGTRGPTYVDVTTSSFCCSTCAGVLRGINPPHRIKSISMATFTSEEVETLKEGGNELNRRTWMGLHPGAQVTNFASKDDRTNFIIDKYEKKKWYVSPEEVAKQKELLERAVEAKSEQLKMNNPRNDSFDLFSSVSLGGNQSVRPPPSVSLDSVFAPPSLLGGVSLERVVGLDEPHPFSPPAFMAPPPPPQTGTHLTSLPISQQPTHMPINFAFGSPPSGLLPQSRQSDQMFSSTAAVHSPVDPFSPLSTVTKQFPKDSSVARMSSSFLPPSMDPFGPSTTSSTGGDPFGASAFSGFAIKFDEDTPTTSAPPPLKGGQIGVANPFDSFGIGTLNNGASSHSSPLPSAPPPSSSSLDPFASIVSLHPAATSAAPTVSQPISSVSPAMVNRISPHGAPSPSIPPVVSNSDADKYSALAELDELFHTTTISSDSSNGKPSWVSTGFSAPPPTTGAAFPHPTAMTKSSTMGAISSTSSTMTPSSSVFGGGIPTPSSSTWGVNNPSGSAAPFSQPLQGFSHSNLVGSTGMGGVPTQSAPFHSMNTTTPQQSHYAQAAAMTGNPFSPFPASQAHSQQSQQNPNWNPFL